MINVQQLLKPGSAPTSAARNELAAAAAAWDGKLTSFEGLAASLIADDLRYEWDPQVGPLRVDERQLLRALRCIIASGVLSVIMWGFATENACAVYSMRFTAIHSFNFLPFRNSFF